MPDELYDDILEVDGEIDGEDFLEVALRQDDYLELLTGQTVTTLEPVDNPNRWKVVGRGQRLPDTYQLSAYETSEARKAGNEQSATNKAWQQAKNAYEAGKADRNGWEYQGNYWTNAGTDASGYRQYEGAKAVFQCTGTDGVLYTSEGIPRADYERWYSWADRNLKHYVELARRGIITDQDATKLYAYWSKANPPDARGWYRKQAYPDAPPPSESVTEAADRLREFFRTKAGKRQADSEDWTFNVYPGGASVDHDYSQTPRQPGESLKDEALRKMQEDLNALLLTMLKKRK